MDGQYYFSVDGMSRDGARIDVDLLDGSGRLDIASGRLDVLPLRGELTADGSAIIGLTPDPSPHLRRHEISDIAGTRDITYPSLPTGWQISEWSRVAIDDAGRQVGITAVNPALGLIGPFKLDTVTGSWSQPVAAVPHDSISIQTWSQAFNADGRTIAVGYHSPAGTGNDRLWHIAPDGVAQLINQGAPGGPPGTGYMHLLDMSPDGRHVLLGWTAGIGGSPDGMLFVHDVVTGSTSFVRDRVDPTVGTISDDGRVVASVAIREGGFPALELHIGDHWVTLRPVPTDWESDSVSGGLAMNGQGTRLAYTNAVGRVLLIDFVGTGR